MTLHPNARLTLSSAHGWYHCSAYAVPSSLLGTTTPPVALCLGSGGSFAHFGNVQFLALFESGIASG